MQEPTAAEPLGKRIRRLRESKAMSVPDLASSVGVSESAIRQLECGQSKNPGFALGLRLANTLSTDPWYLALGEGFSITDQLDTLARTVGKLETRVTALERRR
jgi:transcriptional regulator with XRE-family HTH domain